LHTVSDNDRGGNEVWVRVDRKTDRLHSFWDSGLLIALGWTPKEIANGLLRDLTKEKVQAWSAGTPQQWAQESFVIARDFIYPQSRGANTRETAIVLPAAYRDKAAPIIAEQLSKTGIRLAWILNAAFPNKAVLSPSASATD
jgi:hypothetical protein